MLIVRILSPGRSLYRIYNRDPETLLHTDVSSLCSDLRELASWLESRAIEERSAILLIPGELVLSRTLELPPGDKSRLMKSLPYLVEDDLGTSVEKNHVAVLHQEKKRLLLGVVAHDLIRSWIKDFSDIGIDIEAIHSDASILPLSEDNAATFFVTETGRTLMRSVQGTSAVVSSDCLGACLPALMAELGIAEKPVVDVYFAGGGSPKEDEIVSALETVAGCVRAKRVGLSDTEKQNIDQIIPGGDMFDHWLLACADTDFWQSLSSNGLLYGEYKITQTAGIEARYWGYTAAAAVLVICIKLASDLIYGGLASANAARAAEANEKIYREMFPTVTRVVDPKRQTLAALREMGASDNSPSVLTIMESVTRHLATQPGATQRITYTRQGSTILLEIKFGSPQFFAAFVQHLRSEGYEVNAQEEREEGWTTARIGIRV